MPRHPALAYQSPYSLSRAVSQFADAGFPCLVWLFITHIGDLLLAFLDGDDLKEANELSDKISDVCSDPDEYGKHAFCVQEEIEAALLAYGSRLRAEQEKDGNDRWDNGCLNKSEIPSANPPSS